MKKVIYVPESFPQPSETFVINEISGLLDYDYDITVVPRTNGVEGGVIHSKLQSILANIRVIIKNSKIDFSALFLAFKYGGQVKQGIKPRALIKKIKNAVNISKHVYRIKAQTPEIIIIHFGYDNAIAGIIAAKQLKIPSILWLHGSDMYTVPHRNLVWLTDTASSVVTNSKYSISLLKGLGVTAFVNQSYLGVDLNKFSPSSSAPKTEHPVIISIARLGHNKNHKALFNTFQVVQSRLPKASLWLIGDGPNRTKYQDLVKQMNLNNVVFWGALPQEKIVELLRQAWVKVLLSEHEGLGVAFIEAHATGVPCYGTNIGGIPEVIDNNKTGFLFDLDSSSLAENVANSVINLLEDEDLYQKVSQSARMRAIDIFDEKSHIKFMHYLITKNLNG